MKKRNIFLLFITLLLTISLVGCGTSQKASDKSLEEIKPSAESPSNDKVEKKDETIEPFQANTHNEKTEKKTEEYSTEEKTQTLAASKPSPSKTAAKTIVKNSSTINTTKPKSATKTTTASTTTSQSTATKKSEPQTTVTFSIKGPKEVGTIVGATKIVFKDGDTVFDILRSVAKKKGFVVDSTGSGATAYIAGIDNIYEFDYGVKSGWVFKQNGTNLTKSVGVTKVKDGDQIECYYTK